MTSDLNPRTGNEFWQPGSGARQVGYTSPYRDFRIAEIRRLVRAAYRPAAMLTPWLYTPDIAVLRDNDKFTEWAVTEPDGLTEMLSRAAECIAWRAAQTVALPGLRIPVVILDITEPLTAEVAKLHYEIVTGGPAAGVATALIVPQASFEYCGAAGASLTWSTGQG